MVPIKNEKLLVIGARGFLGSHLCDRLVSSGVQVYGVTRSKQQCVRNGVHWRQGDFADIQSARSVIRSVQPDVIFHLAGVVTAAPDVSLVLPTLHSIVVSTVNTLLIANEVGCRRVVLAGSLTEPPLGQDFVPTSPYTAAKWAGSVYARMFHQLYDLPVVIVRPFMAYGPRQSAEKLIPHVTVSLLKGRAPKLSNGNWQVDWIYIDDIIGAFVAAAMANGIVGRTIDVGTGVLVSVRTIVEQLVGLTHATAKPIFGAIADRPLEEVRFADIANSYELLGWKPAVPLIEGLRRTVQWYEQRIKEGVL